MAHESIEAHENLHTIGKRKFADYQSSNVTAVGRRRKRTRRAGSYNRRKRYGYKTRNLRTAGYIGIEKKFYDTAYSASVPGVAADCTGAEADPTTVNSVSAPAQGDGEQNRDGKKIVAKYLSIKGMIQLANQINQTALAPPVEVKVAIVLDTQTNAAQLNSEDVYKNQVAAIQTLPQSNRDLEYGVRFKILKEDNFMLEPKHSTWDGTNIEVAGAKAAFDWYIPLKDLVINFNGTATAGVASVLDNSIHVIAYASSATLVPTLQYNSRLRFIG